MSRLDDVLADLGEDTDAARPVDHFAHAQTQVGNSERFALRWGHRVRFVATWGKWIAWNGSYWESDERGLVREFAKELTTDIVRAGRARLAEVEAADHDDDDDREAAIKTAKAMITFGLNSQTRGNIESLIHLATSIPAIVLTHDQLDPDTMRLTVTNGTLDLRTGKLGPHRRSDYITRSLPYAYDAAAACPLWTTFLDTVLAGDAEVTTFLQRSIGYSLTGDIREHVMFILHGEGKNGKSVFTRTLQSLLGPYGLQASDSLLLDTGNSSNHPTELASLKGMRAAVCSETPKGRTWNENRVKALTGGDAILARRMREDFWQFEPTHKFWICTNNKPNTRETNEAMQRRLRFVPFLVTIPESERDTQLPEKLAVELPGILAWAVRGCLDWQSHGLAVPKAVEESGASYFEAQDPIRRWIRECCIVDANVEGSARDLYQSYATWADGQQETQTAFGSRLTDLGYPSRKKNSGNYRVGLKLTL